MLSYALLFAAGVGVLAVTIGAVAWRRALLMLLPFLTILNGLTIPMGSSSVRVDQLAACLLVVPLGVSVLTGERRLRMDATVWWLAAILAVNLVSSALNSPARSYSLLQCANLASAWVIYVVLINFLDSPEELEHFFGQCLWAALTAGAIGVVAFVLAIARVPVGGAEVSQSAVDQLTRPYGAYGFTQEPNIFGSFTGAWLVLAVGLLATSKPASGGPRTRLVTWLAATSAAGLVLSFTRAAWIGTIVGIGCLAILGARTQGSRLRLSRILVPLGAGSALMLTLTLIAGNARSLLEYKLLNLLNLDSATAVLRLSTYALALQQTLEHAVIGWGTFTFAPLVAQGNDFQQFEGWRQLWIGNFLLLALHDTGVIGLLLWVGLLWTVLRRGIRAVQAARVDDSGVAARTLALTAAVASLLIPFLSTTGFSLGYAWLLIGLLGAYSRRAELGARSPSTEQEPPALTPASSLPLRAN